MSEKDRVKEYYINNRDILLNRANEYYINNKESINPKIQRYPEDIRRKSKDKGLSKRI